MDTCCKIFFAASTFLITVPFYQSNAESNTYIAAVVGIKAEKLLAIPEYALYTLTGHYDTIVSYLHHNISYKPDIIVFPEGGLQGPNLPYPVEVPSTEDEVVPCTLEGQFDMALRRLSCTAKENNVYLAVNLVESHFNISINRTMKFNTNVVFDRRGAIVARYRKSNLVEIGYDTPGKPDISFFQSDFGVTFGLFTGDDLYFKEPMKTLVEKYGIRHFIHPTKWDNELPFFTGIQMQSGWAYATNSVLLSAGYNHPEIGYSGIGIYQGQYGPLESSQPEASKDFALITTVPKNVDQPKSTLLRAVFPIFGKQSKGYAIPLEKVIKQPTLLLEENIEKMEERIRNRHTPQKMKAENSAEYRSWLKLKRDKVESYKTKLIEPVIDEVFKTMKVAHEGLNGSITINETICTGTNKNQFCCKFELKVNTFYITNISNFENIKTGDNFTNYFYRLALYDGIKQFSNRDRSVPGNIQVCGIIPCLNKKIDSCALRTDLEPPNEAKAHTVDINGITYTKIATTFQLIKIETEIKNNDSTIYPIYLHKSSTTDEFGRLPNTATYTFTKEVKNNTNTLTVSLQSNEEITDLGSVGVLTRIYHVPSSSIKTKFSYSIMIFPFIIMRFITS